MNPNENLTGIPTTALRPENAPVAPIDPELEAHRPPVNPVTAASADIDPSIKPFDPAEFDQSTQVAAKDNLNNKESNTLDEIFREYEEKLKTAKLEAKEISDFFNHTGKTKAENNGLIPPTKMPDFNTLAKALIDANFAEINRTMENVPKVAESIGESAETHIASLMPQFDESLQRAQEQVASIPANPTLVPTPDQAAASENLQKQLNNLSNTSLTQAPIQAPQPTQPVTTATNNF